MIRRFENGDIVTNGAQFATGAEAVGLGIKHRLRLFLGEYFLDVREGTPWFQSILGKTSEDVAEVQLKRRVLSAPGVAFIRRFEFDTEFGSRKASVSVTVRTVDGYDADTTLDEALT